MSALSGATAFLCQKVDSKCTQWLTFEPLLKADF